MPIDPFDLLDALPDVGGYSSDREDEEEKDPFDLLDALPDANLPQRNNNPGNLKDSALTRQYTNRFDAQGHAIVDDPDRGMELLRRDIEAKKAGRSNYLKGDETLRGFGRVWAEDVGWADGVGKILGVNPDSVKFRDIDTDRLVAAIRRQEGYDAGASAYGSPPKAKGDTLATADPSPDAIPSGDERAGAAVQPEAADMDYFTRNIGGGIVQGAGQALSALSGLAELAGRSLNAVNTQGPPPGAPLAAGGVALQGVGDRVTKAAQRAMGEAQGLDEEIVRGVASSLPSMLATTGIGAAFTGPAAGAMANTRAVQVMGRVLARIPFSSLRSGGATAGQAFVGSMIANTLTNQVYEASSQYADAKGKGLSEADAQAQAAKVFALNMATAFTNLVEALPGSKRMVRALLGAIQEGAEEGVQDVISRVAAGEEVAVDKQMGISVLAGVILGGGVASIGGKASDRVFNKKRVVAARKAHEQAQTIWEKSNGDFDTALNEAISISPLSGSSLQDLDMAPDAPLAPPGRPEGDGRRGGKLGDAPDLLGDGPPVAEGEVLSDESADKLLADPRMQAAQRGRKERVQKKLEGEQRVTLGDILKQYGGVNLSKTASEDFKDRASQGVQMARHRHKLVTKEGGEASDVLVERLAEEYPQFGIKSESDLVAALLDNERLKVVLDPAAEQTAMRQEEEAHAERVQGGGAPEEAFGPSSAPAEEAPTFDAAALEAQSQRKLKADVAALGQRVRAATSEEDLVQALDDMDGIVRRFPADQQDAVRETLVGKITERHTALRQQPVEEAAAAFDGVEPETDAAESDQGDWDALEAAAEEEGAGQEAGQEPDKVEGEATTAYQQILKRIDAAKNLFELADAVGIDHYDEVASVDPEEHTALTRRYEERKAAFEGQIAEVEGGAKGEQKVEGVISPSEQENAVPAPTEEDADVEEDAAPAAPPVEPVAEDEPVADASTPAEEVVAAEAPAPRTDLSEADTETLRRHRFDGADEVSSLAREPADIADPNVETVSIENLLKEERRLADLAERKYQQYKRNGDVALAEEEAKKVRRAHRRQRLAELPDNLLPDDPRVRAGIEAIRKSPEYEPFTPAHVEDDGRLVRVHFDGKPDAYTRLVLKEQKFRWDKNSKSWIARPLKADASEAARTDRQEFLDWVEGRHISGVPSRAAEAGGAVEGAAAAEGQAPPAPQFAAGDRVQVVGDYGGRHGGEEGELRRRYEVRRNPSSDKIIEEGWFVRFADGDEDRIPDKHLTNMAPPAAPSESDRAVSSVSATPAEDVRAVRSVPATPAAAESSVPETAAPREEVAPPIWEQEEGLKRLTPYRRPEYEPVSTKTREVSRIEQGRPQVAEVEGDVIRVMDKEYRQVVDRYEMPLGEWVDTYTHANPNWAKRRLIRSKLEAAAGADGRLEGVTPGGRVSGYDISLPQTDRIIDAQVHAIDAALKKAGWNPPRGGRKAGPAQPVAAAATASAAAASAAEPPALRFEVGSGPFGAAVTNALRKGGQTVAGDNSMDAVLESDGARALVQEIVDRAVSSIPDVHFTKGQREGAVGTWRQAFQKAAPAVLTDLIAAGDETAVAVAKVLWDGKKLEVLQDIAATNYMRQHGDTPVGEALAAASAGDKTAPDAGLAEGTGGQPANTVSSHQQVAKRGEQRTISAKHASLLLERWGLASGALAELGAKRSIDKPGRDRVEVARLNRDGAPAIQFSNFGSDGQETARVVFLVDSDGRLKAVEALGVTAEDTKNMVAEEDVERAATGLLSAIIRHGYDKLPAVAVRGDGAAAAATVQGQGDNAVPDADIEGTTTEVEDERAGAEEQQGAPDDVGADGAEALAGERPADVSRPEGGRTARSGGDRGAGTGQGDLFADGGAGGGSRGGAGGGDGATAGTAGATGRGGRGEVGTGRAVDADGRGEQASGRPDEVASDREGEREEALPPSPEAPPRHNHTITEQGSIGRGGAKAKYAANVEAIRLLKQIEGEGRPATPEEKRVLAGFVGWGGIPKAFDYSEVEGANIKTDPQWANEIAELRDLLTPDEYRAARASTPNAHYTSIPVIQQLWKAAERLGFKGGRVLEPSAGVGHFLGAMPTHLRQGSRMTAVELDDISARILKALYEGADVRAGGFQDQRLADNAFDVVISNVPFGNYSLHDRRYPQKFPIHNYFILRSLDKARPGGIVAAITSRYTMDGTGQLALAFRDKVAEQADLLGAVRLPNTAFRGNAATDVVTDVLFFRKRFPGEASNGVKWTRVGDLRLRNGQGDLVDVPINEYYTDGRLEQMLGDPVLGRGMHSEDEFDLEGDGRALDEALGQALEEVLPEGVFNPHEVPAQAEEEAARKEYEGAATQGSIVEQDGAFYQVEDGQLVPFEVKGATTANRLRGLLGLRDAVKDLVDAQQAGASDEELARLRRVLTGRYDKFTKKFRRTVDGKKNQPGALNATVNANLIAEDPLAPMLLSIERVDDDTGEIVKGDIFFRRTVQKDRVATKAETPRDALLLSLAERGHIDLDYMASKAESAPEALVEALAGTEMFYDPDNGWETRAQYLSGDVRAKLKRARFAREGGLAPHDMGPNVQALEGVQPDDIPFEQIGVRLGSPWIPADVYEGFIDATLGGKSRVRYAPAAAFWDISADNEASKSEANRSEYGTTHKSALDLIDATLNLREVKVGHTDRDGKFHLDPEATEAAKAKQAAIQRKFKEWLGDDAVRVERLVRAYNDRFNNTRLPEYDGSHLSFPGLAAGMKLLPHQSAAVWRIVQDGNALLAHAVGAGKTATIAAAAMEVRRLNLAHKPMIAVLKSTLPQWRREFLRFYPGAKILVASDRDFSPRRRKNFMARIQTGDWDAVVVTHEQFERIPMGHDRVQAYLNDQMDKLVRAIATAKQESSDSRDPTVKELEKAKERLQGRLDELLDAAKDDQIPDFEELGVDMLFVDEAHQHKKLFFITRMSRVPSVGDPKGSKRALDLFLKTQYLQETNGGRGVVLATGTPVTNTMSEVYTMQRFLQSKSLDDMGIGEFDNWANVFGEVIDITEAEPSGVGYRINRRFAKFTNLPELMSTFRQVADIQTSKMLNLPTPEVERHLEELPQTHWHKSFVEHLRQVLESIKGKKPEPGAPNALTVVGAGSKAALSPRLINPSLPDFVNGKVVRAADNIYRMWEETAAERGTQVVFSDLGVPSESNAQFNVYDNLKGLLVRRGIPEQEIAFIHDASSDAQRLELQQAFNNGRIRVLIGGTQKMGVGMNLQARLYALHHLDAPWRPADIEQREGRIIRQGNLWGKPGGLRENAESVHLFTYVTQGTFDVYRWQTLETKSRFIEQVMNGDLNIREMEDIDSEGNMYEVAKLGAMGNQDAARKAEVDKEVMSLEGQRAEAARSQRGAQGRLRELDGRIERNERLVPLLEADLAYVEGLDLSKFDAKIADSWTGGTKPPASTKTFDKATDAGKALLKALKIRVAKGGEGELARDLVGTTLTGQEHYTPVGTVFGFTVYAQPQGKIIAGYPKLNMFEAPILRVSRGDQVMYPAKVNPTPEGTIRSIVTVMRSGVKQELEESRRQLEEDRRQRPRVEEATKRGFEEQGRLDALRQEQEELNRRLMQMAAEASQRGEDQWAELHRRHRPNERGEFPEEVLPQGGSGGVEIIDYAAEEDEGRAPGSEGGVEGGGGGLGVREDEVGYQPSMVRMEWPTFYSAVRRVVEEKMPKRMRAADVGKFIRGQQGIKEEELQWLGLDEWLEGRRVVTKEEVEQFLAENEVQIEEVPKNEEGDWGVSPTAYSDLVLPGGRKYQELLLTLPSKEDKALEEEYSALREKLAARYGNRTGDWSAADPDVQAAQALSRRIADQMDDATYQSGHWPDDPNVIAHIRFDERTDAEGRRVLFINEIQSDWHQTGRKKGYRGQTDWNKTELYAQKDPDLSGTYNIFKKEDDSKVLDVVSIMERPIRNENEALDYVKKEIAKDPAYLDKRLGIVTPDAPFKNSWRDLAIKRMLRYAVDNGFDRIAWPGNAEQVATIEQWPDGSAEGHDGVVSFYTQYIPQFLNKFTKKWGGNVEPLAIADEPLFKDAKDGRFWDYRIREKRTGRFYVEGRADDFGPEEGWVLQREWGPYVSREEAEWQLEARLGPAIGDDFGPVNSLPITDKMRQSIREGLTLFEPAAAYNSLASDAPMGDLSGEENSADAALSARDTDRRRGPRQYGSGGRPAGLGAEDAGSDATAGASGLAVGEEGAGVDQGDPSPPAPDQVFGAGGALSEGVPSSSGLTTVARLLRRDVKQGGYVDLSRKVAPTRHDIAHLGQIFRDPRYEWMRYLYVGAESGRVLAHEAFTARLAGAAISQEAVGISPKTPQYRAAKVLEANRERFRKRLARIERREGEKVRVFLLHNHPSGSALPSEPDRDFTRGFRHYYPDVDLAGHVIIDSNEYSVVEGDGTARLFDLASGKEKVAVVPQERMAPWERARFREQAEQSAATDPLFEADMEHAFLGAEANRPDRVARMGEALKQRGDDFVGLFFLSTNKRVRGIVDVHRGFLGQDPGRVEGYLRNQLSDMGASRAVAFYQGSALDKKAFFAMARPMMEAGLLEDAVWLAPDKEYRQFISAREQAPAAYNNRDEVLAGRSANTLVDFPSMRIHEEEGEYSPGGPPAPPPPDNPVAAGNPEGWGRYEAARGGARKDTSWTAKVAEWAPRFWNQLTREFEHLPKTGAFVEARSALLRLQKQHGNAAERARERIADVVDGLTPEQGSLLEHAVVFNDLASELDRVEAQEERAIDDGEAVWFGFTAGDVRAGRAHFQAQVSADPEVQAALAARERTWADLVAGYSEDMKAVGFDVKDRFSRGKDYFRHRVLDKALERGYESPKGAGGIRVPKGRGFLQRRTSLTADFDPEYVTAEHEVMAQMEFDREVARALKVIQDKYDRLPAAKAAAKAHNDRMIKAIYQKLADRLNDQGGVAGQEEPFTGESLYREILNKPIAIGFSKLGKLAAEGMLPVGDRGQWVGVVEALADEAEERAGLAADGIVERASSAPIDGMMPYLAWVAKNHADEPGGRAALQILKAIGTKRETIREALEEADQFRTWEDFVPEGYIEYYPEEKNYFYMADTVPARVSEMLMQEGLEEVGVKAEDLKRVFAMAQREPMIVPPEIAATLDKMRPRDEGSSLRKAADLMVLQPMRQWKKWTLLKPQNVLKYMGRNLSGDVDAVLSGDSRLLLTPSGLRQVKRATRDLFNVMVRGQRKTGDLRDWWDRGGEASTLQAQELDDVADLRDFRAVFPKEDVPGWVKILKAPLSGLKAAFNGVRLANDYREAILRYAAYLDYLDQMERNGGRPDNFGASRREEIMAHADWKDRAFMLSNQLLGAYDQVGEVGQGIRRYIAPFWSWNEVNLRRYKQITANAMKDTQEMAKLGRAAAVKQGLKGAAKLPIMPAAALGRFLLGTTALSAALEVFNHFVFPEEEDELPDDVRARPHLVMGRGDDGRVRYFSRLGALGDVLEWFGLGGAPHLVRQYLNGERTVPEIVKEMAWTPVNKMAQGVGPHLRAPAELYFGQSTWPEVENPRPIRDRGRYVAQTLGVGGLYDAASDLVGSPVPTRDLGWETLADMAYYRVDGDEVAYHQMYDRKRRAAERAGREAGGYFWSPKRDALYNLRRAVRLGDQQAADFYLNRYVARYDGTLEGMYDSFAAMDPLRSGPLRQQETGGQRATIDRIRQRAMQGDTEGAVSAMDEYVRLQDPESRSELAEFIKDLDGPGRRRLVQAARYYQTVLLGQGPTKVYLEALGRGALEGDAALDNRSLRLATQRMLGEARGLQPSDPEGARRLQAEAEALIQAYGGQEKFNADMTPAERKEYREQIRTAARRVRKEGLERARGLAPAVR